MFQQQRRGASAVSFFIRGWRRRRSISAPACQLHILKAVYFTSDVREYAEYAWSAAALRPAASGIIGGAARRRCLPGLAGKSRTIRLSNISPPSRYAEWFWGQYKSYWRNRSASRRHFLPASILLRNTARRGGRAKLLLIRAKN
ncbi:hypothetical protein [Rugamonas sp. DEMB1]|uniref:hypothetical protein n=1 Tax=Rugamonas sp. DEMB1 TaxID=3039386 RepID=UPI00244BC1C1|nr:hypothetical protein [Rugamonas sp. DEMB1]WGG49454.1 hypothetical protein QC826_23275 [Rugamonas sp. DEMB1]